MTQYSKSITLWLGAGAIACWLTACGQSQPPQQTTPAATAPVAAAPASPTIVQSISPTPDNTPLALASQPAAACVTPQTQAEMTRCAGETAKQEDDELNKVYQQLRSALNSKDREERLIDAQLAWISFRDADCAYAVSQFEGGSLQPQVANDCIARLTQQRTAQLKDYLTSAEQGF